MGRATVRPRPTGTACNCLLSSQRVASTLTKKGSSSHLQGKEDPHGKGRKLTTSRHEINVIGWGFIRAYYDNMIL